MHNSHAGRWRAPICVVRDILLADEGLVEGRCEGAGWRDIVLTLRRTL